MHFGGTKDKVGVLDGWLRGLSSPVGAGRGREFSPTVAKPWLLHRPSVDTELLNKQHDDGQKGGVARTIKSLFRIHINI